MKKNDLLGGILALAGAVMGIVGFFVLFFNWYQTGMHAESAEPGCEILLKYIHPALTDMGLLGSVLFAVSAYGFFTKQKWAFALSTMALVLVLLASWFINVPFMAGNLPPVYFILFWPYLLGYFLMTIVVGKLPWNRALFALLTGIAYIFCFMNGVSSTSRIITHGADIFVLVQRLHFVAMVGLAVITVGILLKPQPWMFVVGLVSAALELTVGIPLALVTAGQLGRFSLFALGPIACLILIVLLLIPHMWDRLTGTYKKPAAGLGLAGSV